MKSCDRGVTARLAVRSSVDGETSFAVAKFAVARSRGRRRTRRCRRKIDGDQAETVVEDDETAAKIEVRDDDLMRGLLFGQKDPSPVTGLLTVIVPGPTFIRLWISPRSL